jgi:putative transposase
LERFQDQAPRHVYAELLDEGTYLASPSTMYRILTAHGESSERRNQREARSHAVPRLEATRPNQVWPWDIVRHEAPLNRAVMKGHGHRSVAADREKLRAA